MKYKNASTAEEWIWEFISIFINIPVALQKKGKWKLLTLFLDLFYPFQSWNSLERFQQQKKCIKQNCLPIE